MAKITYIVRGSEDGNLAVCGNRGRAVDIAIHYASMNGDRKLDNNRAGYMKALKNKGHVFVEPAENNGFANAEIEEFETNYYHFDV